MTPEDLAAIRARNEEHKGHQCSDGEYCAEELVATVETLLAKVERLLVAIADHDRSAPDECFPIAPPWSKSLARPKVGQ